VVATVFVPSGINVPAVDARVDEDDDEDVADALDVETAMMQQQ
jgi:hypothetical protein